MEIETPFAWTIAEANRLADDLAKLRQAGSLAMATTLWINDIRNRATAPLEIVFPPKRHNSVKARFHNAFSSCAGRDLSTEEMFGDKSVWCDGSVYVKTEKVAHRLLYQFVRTEGVSKDFPLNALVALLSEADVAFGNSEWSTAWETAATAYGFSKSIVAPFTHHKHQWWPFLAYISETQNLPIRYTPRYRMGFVYAGENEWIDGGPSEEPFEWSEPIPLSESRFFSNTQEEVRLNDDPSGWQRTFGYVCHWFDVLRASELACRWVAAKLTTLQVNRNLGAGFGDPFANFGSAVPEPVAFPATITKSADSSADSMAGIHERILADSEALFRAVVRYCEARREFWGTLEKAQQRSFFPPIFETTFSLYDQLSKCETLEFEMMRVGNGCDLRSRGIEIIRKQVFWLTFQYPVGVECIVANTLPDGFSEEADVACPDFRVFISPLRMALGLMGSKLGDTPKETWWHEPPCEVVFGNPIPACLPQIKAKLKAYESGDLPDIENSDDRLPEVAPPFGSGVSVAEPVRPTPRNGKPAGRKRKEFTRIEKAISDLIDTGRFENQPLQLAREAKAFNDDNEPDVELVARVRNTKNKRKKNRKKSNRDS